jgi:uncharacterized protein (TIGR03435 family)
MAAATIVGTVVGPVSFIVVNASGIYAQSAPAIEVLRPFFEVTSVRRSRPGESTSFHVAPNRLVVRNMLMQYIIGITYSHDWGEFGITELAHDRVVGGPRWVYPGEFNYEGYDIEGKVDDALAEKFGKDCGRAFFLSSCGYRMQMLSMFQGLLADRFKLKVRWETKQGPVYDLVVAKGGPRFLHTKFDVPDHAAIAKNPALRPPCPAGMFCYQDYLSMGRVADWLSESR